MIKSRARRDRLWPAQLSHMQPQALTLSLGTSCQSSLPQGCQLPGLSVWAGRTERRGGNSETKAPDVLQGHEQASACRPILERGKLRPERFRKLSTVTQLVRGRARPSARL